MLEQEMRIKQKEKERSSQVVLVTGCSSGIGRELVQRLTKSGYAVVATAKNVETLGDVDAALRLPLDVTQQDSVTQL